MFAIENIIGIVYRTACQWCSVNMPLLFLSINK